MRRYAGAALRVAAGSAASQATIAPQRQTIAAPRQAVARHDGEVRGYAAPHLVQRQCVPSQREQRVPDVVMESTPEHVVCQSPRAADRGNARLRLDTAPVVTGPACKFR